MFALGIKNEKMTTNPARAIAHRQENNARVRYLTAAEEMSLIAAVRKMAPSLEAKILVALHSGMRRSEMFKTDDCPDGGLKWAHVNFQANLITLPRSKTGESRRIPINAVLRETLQKLRTVVGSVYVFAGGPPDRIFPHIVKAAKIWEFNWHDLRHTFASRLVMDGVDIRTVQELMGHKSIVTTMRYSHLAETHLAAAVERLTRPTRDPSENLKLAL